LKNKWKKNRDRSIHGDFSGQHKTCIQDDDRNNRRERERGKKASFGPIKKISWPTNTKKNDNVFYASIKKDEVCT